MSAIAYIIGAYIIYAAIQIGFFKYKEAKFQKQRSTNNNYNNSHAL
ncbi:hypothetical protein [Caminibacter pacificus]|uniref:Uncharacterized protein n=1 Tax=Caminibacter pacificus TaxID=1424653 RepID=A0AAJ4UY95_9BACT|nr:hypothetical protein [Caminibacter pacificus]NPA88020.1 hypothetical protein [Campylobacterota bacterium]ROR40700.1 hypothetical protein EDC58_0179 [Caminibacter pacificus]